MADFDAIIVGGATSGSYFAKLLAEKGWNVLVLEKDSVEKVGGKYDIFHIPSNDFEKFSIPRPKKGDKAWAFEFEDSCSLSASSEYPKNTKMGVVGLHMHEYVLSLNEWAKSFGTKFLYQASFLEIIENDDKISGVKYLFDGEQKEVSCRLLVDCSGIPSVVRRSLKESVIENFAITPLDMFYVILRYVTFNDPKDYIKASRGWLFYKTWIAPQPNEKGGIIGIGANFSFDYAEKMYKVFESKVTLPPYTLDYIERGATPFRRPPYSFVDDGVLIMGDAACLTKPFNGEGVVSSFVQTKIAIKVVDKALRQNGYITKERLWDINREYVAQQGAKFASSLATLIGAIDTSEKENNYFYKKDIIFNQKSFQCMNDYNEIRFDDKDISVMTKKLIFGVLTGNVRIKTIKSLLSSMGKGDKIKAHYLTFPTSPNGFDAWKTKADEIWKEIGTVSSTAKDV